MLGNLGRESVSDFFSLRSYLLLQIVSEFPGDLTEDLGFRKTKQLGNELRLRRSSRQMKVSAVYFQV